MLKGKQLRARLKAEPRLRNYPGPNPQNPNLGHVNLLCVADMYEHVCVACVCVWLFVYVYVACVCVCVAFCVCVS